ncbi:Alpha/Beta hydrolase protein [Mycena belliarum]|uniref:Alpha/Beta hydrolase protein n=1 Tax=Mycena belliarum TaxID=1033014 RepID=A0AAD6UIA2_9AGAR|nr:Alpha/Beta hydrolase protein [Mycena belliae]
MGPRLSRFLTYLLLLVPPLVVSFYLLASFPPPPPPLPLPTFPGLDSLSPDSRAREIYPIDWAGNGSGHWADLPLGRTRYWLVGPESGKKIVLIHGLSVPALVWAPLVPQLTAAGYRVLLYDLYGRGYSAAPAAAAYDANLYVTQLALLMQHAGWARARVAGLSMGGAVAAAFVNAFPALVERDVVLVACAGLVEASELSRTAKVMSSPIVQTLTTNPLHRHNANDPPSPVESNGGVDAPLADLVRLQSAHLHGFNRAVSRSLRAGPITGLAWAFDTRGSVGGEGGEGEEGGKGVWSGRRVLVVHVRVAFPLAFSAVLFPSPFVLHFAISIARSIVPHPHPPKTPYPMAPCLQSSTALSSSPSPSSETTRCLSVSIPELGPSTLTDTIAI